MSTPSASAAPVQTPETPRQSPALGLALISGRITSLRPFTSSQGRMIETILKLPAPDEFSTPQTVSVRSAQKLGEVGEIIRGKVRIGGWGRSYETTDEYSGHKVKVPTATNTLEWVA